MNRPLRFLHITTFYPPYSFGGDGVYVYRLAHALAEAGHQVDVIHCIDSYNLLSRGQTGLEMPGHPNVTAFGMRSGFGWLSPLLSHQSGRPLLNQRAIARVLDDKRYDVIHYHNISLFGPGILALAPPASAAVKLYTIHEHWLICPTHVLWKFNRRPCERPQCLQCVLRAGRPPQLWRYSGFLERAIREVDLFLAPSRFTARIHAERGFKGPLAHLPLFTERSDADWQQPAPSLHPRPYFLFVGRLELIKGLHTLIELWSRIGCADLLVVGDGPEAGKLRALAANNPHIRFLGAVCHNELGALYSNSLACVVPSLAYEIAPLVTIEAFARKTPVIAHDLGGLSELVGESGGGLVYRTSDELSEALQRIASSPELRTELGENGYQAFTRCWSKEVHLEMYFELLRQTAIRKFGHLPWEAEADR
jgi:glycosyltransferase involved in cell wall biosynthesis